MSLSEKIKNSWDAFIGRDPTRMKNYDYSRSDFSRPDRVALTRGNERSIMTSAINRIAVDAAQIRICHVQLDEHDRYLQERKSNLNYCLTKSANLDQAATMFRQNIFMSLLDEGSLAIAPIRSKDDPDSMNAFDPTELRIGRIKEWKPNSVVAEFYNEATGEKKDLNVDKRWTVILENPFYAIMNEQNSILKRIVRKLNLMDVIDEQSGSGKLDMIIQLPYTVKSDLQKERAEDRRRSIEQQLSENKFGIAYIDSTEHVTQLNRSIENKLMAQIEYLIGLFFSQLGITQGVLDGTADENTMNNYYSRSLEPLLTCATEEMERKWLTKTAISQGQAIKFFRDPFKMIPTSLLPDMMDKLTRNEIVTSNEARQIIGMKPSKDPNADVLRNKNISQSKEEAAINIDGEQINQNDLQNQDRLNSNLEDIVSNT